MLIILFLMVASLNALVKNKLYSTLGKIEFQHGNGQAACIFCSPVPLLSHDC